MPLYNRCECLKRESSSTSVTIDLELLSRVSKFFPDDLGVYVYGDDGHGELVCECDGLVEFGPDKPHKTPNDALQYLFEKNNTLAAQIEQWELDGMVQFQDDDFRNQVLEAVQGIVAVEFQRK